MEGISCLIVGYGIQTYQAHENPSCATRGLLRWHRNSAAWFRGMTTRKVVYPTSNSELWENALRKSGRKWGTLGNEQGRMQVPYQFTDNQQTSFPVLDFCIASIATWPQEIAFLYLRKQTSIDKARVSLTCGTLHPLGLPQHHWQRGNC